MIIQQISVFVENKPGTLAEVLDVLKEHDVNLRALSVADTADFGILRMIVNEPEKAERILRGAGLTLKTTPVLVVVVEDTPGNLHEQVQRLSVSGINIEYMYSFAALGTKEAMVVLKVDDLARAEGIVNGESTTSIQQREGQDVPNFYW